MTELEKQHDICVDNFRKAERELKEIKVKLFSEMKPTMDDFRMLCNFLSVKWDFEKFQALNRLIEIDNIEINQRFGENYKDSISTLIFNIEQFSYDSRGNLILNGDSTVLNMNISDMVVINQGTSETLMWYSVKNKNITISFSGHISSKHKTVYGLDNIVQKIGEK